MTDFKCVICSVNLCSLTSYRNHCSSNIHIKTLESVRQQQLKNIKLQTDIQGKESYNCSYCDKSYCNKGNLTRHKKICTELKSLKENYIKNIDKLIDTDIELNRIEQRKNSNTQKTNAPNITINIQQNITNNNTANIVNNIEITADDLFNNFWKQADIRPMGFEDLSGLDSQEIADKIHGFGLNCFVEFINQIYKNDVNHNIALFNKREKLVKYVHKSGEIKIDSLVSVMSAILMNLVDYLDTYLDRTDITIKPEFLSIIQKLKAIHLLEENPNIERYNTHLYNRLLNITTSSLKKMKNYDTKTSNELSDSLKKLTLNIPRTNSRTEPDILAVS
jgi:hypothetical protein